MMLDHRHAIQEWGVHARYHVIEAEGYPEPDHRVALWYGEKDLVQELIWNRWDQEASCCYGKLGREACDPSTLPWSLCPLEPPALCLL